MKINVAISRKVRRVWTNAKQRCTYAQILIIRLTNNTCARGITFSEAFIGKEGLKRFIDELGGEPRPAMTLHLIDNDKGLNLEISDGRHI